MKKKEGGKEEKQFRDLFRMSKATFEAFLSWLRINEGLRGTRYQTTEQKLMVVLYIFGRGRDQRAAAHKFGITQSSISRTMTTVLTMLVSLHKAFVRLPEDDWQWPRQRTHHPALNNEGGESPCAWRSTLLRLVGLTRAPCSTSWRKRLQQGLQSHLFSRKTAKTGSFFREKIWPLKGSFII